MNNLMCSYNLTKNGHVGFGVLTAVTMRSTTFWDVTPYRPVKNQLTFHKNIRSASCLIYADFFLRELLFDPDDGGDTVLRNVGSLSPNQTSLHPTKLKL
jgi:hypothetical protein